MAFTSKWCCIKNQLNYMYLATKPYRANTLFSQKHVTYPGRSRMYPIEQFRPGTTVGQQKNMLFYRTLCIVVLLIIIIIAIIIIAILIVAIIIVILTIIII